MVSTWNSHSNHKYFTHTPIIFDNGRWALTIRLILGPHNMLIDRLTHLQLRTPMAFPWWWTQGSLLTQPALYHRIVLCILAPLPLAYWLVSLTIWQQWAFHKATSTLALLTLNPQHTQGRTRSESKMVTLLHPGGANLKVGVIYCTRECTDQIYVYISVIVNFIECWLLPCSGWADSASQWHAYCNWTHPSFWNSSLGFIWQLGTCWWCAIFTQHLGTLCCTCRLSCSTLCEAIWAVWWTL